MFQVLVPTSPDNGYASDPDPRRAIYTRRGRLFTQVEPAKRLAAKHLGKVIDVNSGIKVADYLVG